MKIARQFPQFAHERALLIVTARQEIALYLATAGEIKLIEAVKLEKPRFSDREGFFQKLGKGTGTSAPDERIKEQMVVALVRELRAKLKDVLAERPTAVYLFVPAHLARVVQAALPAALRKDLKRIIRGDFFEAHPFELLRRLRIS